MRRKFEELRENLDEFVDQTEYSVLVVGCLPDELAYVLKFLQGLEDKHAENFFLPFGQDFDAPGPYLDALTGALRGQMDAAVAVRAERNEPPFPPIPSELFEAHRPADQRLLDLLKYLCRLLPDEPGHAVVAAFLPLRCQDFSAYARLVASVILASETEPWMPLLRVVFYDDRSMRLLANAMQKRAMTHVLTFEVDFSTPALTDALTKDAANTTLPVAERMASLLQLAALDYSYQRYSDALEKYRVLYTYYEETKIPSMQAICLLGTGDTLRATGDLPAAKQMLQRGIALCLEHNVLGVLLNLCISAVDVSFSLKHYPDAESYADSGAKVAAGLLNPFVYADMLERRGDAQIEQRKLGEAIESYKRCGEISRMYEIFPRWKSVLEKQAGAFERAERPGDRRAAQKELACVVELEKRGSTGPARRPQLVPEG
jgi:tetratricopeptide (TPR) repeat protein